MEGKKGEEKGRKGNGRKGKKREGKAFKRDGLKAKREIFYFGHSWSSFVIEVDRVVYPIPG